MSKTDKLLVVAIDFGTTYSGYAFQWRHEYDVDKMKISTNNWTGSTALVSKKTPSIVLLDKDKKFAAFGYEAEDKYNTLASEDLHHDYYYFKRFKMMLYDKKVCILYKWNKYYPQHMKCIKFGV